MPIIARALSDNCYCHVINRHVRRYHRHYGTSGHVWQWHYKSFLVQDSDHLLTVVRCIEVNPVRAGLTQTAPGWQLSSHAVRENAGDELEPDALPEVLPADWTTYVDMPQTDSELEKVRNSVNRQSPFGKEKLQNEVCRENGLESTIRDIGRPKEMRGYAEK